MDFDFLSACAATCPDARELHRFHGSVAHRVVIFTEWAVYHFVECNIYLNPILMAFSTPWEHYVCQQQYWRKIDHSIDIFYTYERGSKMEWKKSNITRVFYSLAIFQACALSSLLHPVFFFSPKLQSIAHDMDVITLCHTLHKLCHRFSGTVIDSNAYFTASFSGPATQPTKNKNRIFEISSLFESISVFISHEFMYQ